MNTTSRSNTVLALTAALALSVGESATATVDYRSARGGTYQSTTLYFEWENEKWRKNPKQA